MKVLQFNVIVIKVYLKINNIYANTFFPTNINEKLCEINNIQKSSFKN